MHYGNYAFSTNRRMTIVSKSNPRETLGQRNGLSAIDVRQLNKYYECRGTGTGTKPKPTTRPDPSCQNSYLFCSAPAITRYCRRTTKEGKWVKKYCKKSCNLCVTRSCIDKNGYCKNWARGGYCTGRHAGYMKANCAKSCKKC